MIQIKYVIYLNKQLKIILNLNIKKKGIENILYFIRDFFIHLFRSRFIYDVFIEDDWGKIVLEFDLEVVAIQGKELGIQRKRTKGSAWHYKRCCEDIIGQLTRLLPHFQTSV
jgi:hypothetical protein